MTDFKTACNFCMVGLSLLFELSACSNNLEQKSVKEFREFCQSRQIFKVLNDKKWNEFKLKVNEINGHGPLKLDSRKYMESIGYSYIKTGPKNQFSVKKFGIWKDSIAFYGRDIAYLESIYLFPDKTWYPAPRTPIDSCLNYHQVSERVQFTYIGG
ncbi:hypothetical protein KCG44_01850 [Pacificimonas sp. WHA3]|uniref:Lipoprotein n=1 Tax=Pacificimonas pallii TaxID=2827236 RepID=A0ABS6SAU7_9SPHN|nr:hypothetical protein [Pacificimonas pallii]MBV7255523.1 hypothetical protein [Pacificimonas pallii]